MPSRVLDSFVWRCHLASTVIPIVKIRQFYMFYDSLISTVAFPQDTWNHIFMASAKIAAISYESRNWIRFPLNWNCEGKCTSEMDTWMTFLYPPMLNEVERGYTGFTLSVRPSVHPSVDRIVSAVYLLQYLPDPFHIYTSYQATSEGVSCVKFFFESNKFEVLANS